MADTTTPETYLDEHDEALASIDEDLAADHESAFAVLDAICARHAAMSEALWPEGREQLAEDNARYAYASGSRAKRPAHSNEQNR